MKPLELSPDGAVYWAAAAGKGVPSPYNLRPLLPFLLGTNAKAWYYANVILICIFASLCAVYAGSLWAIPLVLLGPAMWFWMKRPVLVDIYGLTFGLAAAVFAPVDPFLAGALLIFGTFGNEKVPIFAAIFAWNPIMLAALAIPPLLYKFARNGPVPETLEPGLARQMVWITENPWEAAKNSHSGTLSNASKWVLPWGGMLLALIAPSTPLIVGLIVAYGLCCAGTDSVRLYAWATPLMVAAACTAPGGILLGAVAFSWFMRNYDSGAVGKVRDWV